MKTTVVFATLVACALASAVPCKSVNATCVTRQKKVLELLSNVEQVDRSAKCYKAGKEYNIEANIENYTNKKAVEHFLMLYKIGFMPKCGIFSIFCDKQREQAIALFQLFFYAKDFDTFYKTACFARVYIQGNMFKYCFYIAVIQRADICEFVLPPLNEIFPEKFINKCGACEIDRYQLQNGIESTKLAEYGVVKEKETFVIYTNYSDYLTYPNEEQRLSYFTEDIGLNSYYFNYHAQSPFWWNCNKFSYFNKNRGEHFLFFYQQLLARYYLERLSNGLGEIPPFAWNSPIPAGFYPLLCIKKYPFAQRSNDYNAYNVNNYEKIGFIDSYEKAFLQILQCGQFNAFNEELDLNFVEKYWNTNTDLHEGHYNISYKMSYDITARQVLSGSPDPLDDYYFIPSALDFYSTSLRDPMFYGLYSRIIKYILQYTKYLPRYAQDDLKCVGVKINEVKVDKLITYFDLCDYGATNLVLPSKDDSKPCVQDYKIRKPCLNHKRFTTTVEVVSDVATCASVKIFMGPKYDGNGNEITMEKNWMNFVLLDWFPQQLNAGENTIERNSDDFLFYKKDPLSVTELMKLLDKGKLPKDMCEEYDSRPNRLMLPRGTRCGFPLQLFIIVYPDTCCNKKEDKSKEFAKLLNKKSLGFPLDRPPTQHYFSQSNMCFKDVLVYHEGGNNPYKCGFSGFNNKSFSLLV